MNKVTKGVRTKQHLYKCAMQLFKEKGYDNVTVEEIAQLAETAKGTFYIYFESKADVITYSLRQYDDYYSKVYMALDPKETVNERLLKIVLSSAEFTEETLGLDLLRVLYASLLSGDIHQEELYNNRELYSVVHKLVKEGQENGEYLTEHSSEIITNRIVRCIRGTFYEWCIQNGGFDLKQECSEWVADFCKSMCATTTVTV